MSRFPYFLLLPFLFAPALHAQPRPADMAQDIQYLREEVGQLRLEVQVLRRENEELKRSLNALQSSQGQNTASSAALRQTEERLEQLRSEMTRANSKTKEEVIATVTRLIENLASQINATSPPSPTSSPRQPPANIRTEFGDDFPKTGVEHKVERGESLWIIARKYNSQVEWIINANKISNPSAIHVGSTLFVPVRN